MWSWPTFQGHGNVVARWNLAVAIRDVKYWNVISTTYRDYSESKLILLTSKWNMWPWLTFEGHMMHLAGENVTCVRNVTVGLAVFMD